MVAHLKSLADCEGVEVKGRYKLLRQLVRSCRYGDDALPVMQPWDTAG